MIEIEQKIPSEYMDLYSNYVACLVNKCETIMWVVLDCGHKRMMIDKEKHKAMIEKLLVSGDDRKVKVAEEVMSRTLGVWRVR